MPNQDAAGSQIAADRDGGQVLLIAVADGHGDSRHFRSDRGARLAVSEGLAAAAGWADVIPPGPADARASAADVLVPDIVARWNRAVQADILADPLTDAEDEPAPNTSRLSSVAYGATLLVSVITADCAVMIQIGDGDILAVQPDGTCLSPVPADPSLDGRRTTSICQADAAAAFRVGVVELANCPLFAVLAATDGFGNSQADDRWQPPVAADLVRLAREHGLDWLAHAVPGWAQQCASPDGSGDDCTLALAVNSEVTLGAPGARPDQGWSRTRSVLARTLRFTEPQPSPAGPGASATADDQPADEPSRPHRRLTVAAAFAAQRSRWLVAAAVVVLVLLASGSALLVSHHSGIHHHGKAPVHRTTIAPRGVKRPTARPRPRRQPPNERSPAPSHAPALRPSRQTPGKRADGGQT